MKMNNSWGISNVLYALLNDKPLALVRYGDGEINCILHAIFGKGRSKINCDQHAYTEGLAFSLLDVLKRPGKTILGLQRAAKRFVSERHGLKEGEFESLLDTWAPGATWIHSDLFHTASMRGELGSFVDALFRRDPVFVGPEHLAGLPRKPSKHIKIPPVNCYDDRVRIKQEMIKAYQRGYRVFSVSASMAANSIIAEVFRFAPDTILLDMGSVWEPYCGVSNRAYHKNITPEIAERNWGT